MTTIVYKAGVLAADSQISDVGYAVATMRKIARLEDGTLVGGAGGLTALGSFLDWARDGMVDEPPEHDDFEGLIISPGKIRWYGGKGNFVTLEDDFAVIGSGQAAALGALHAGVDAAEACRIATLVDCRSGGPIITLTHGKDPA